MTVGVTEESAHNYLAPSNIYCGDAPKMLERIATESIALSVWSPPYYVGKSYEKHLTFESWQSLLRETIASHFRIMIKGGFLVINIADILCFKDEKMPRIQAPNLNKHRNKITAEDILIIKKQFPEYNRYQLAEHFRCSEQTIDRRLNGNNIRGGKYSTQTRIQLVGHFLEQYASQAGLFLYDHRIWVKDPTWANNQWHSTSYRSVSEYEDIYFFWKPGETIIDRSRLKKEEWSKWGSRQVWSFPSVRVNCEHEAMFPIELPRRVIKLLTKKGDTVLDCFLGSGTTAIAAIQEERKYIGIDVIPEYVDLARKRIELELFAKDGVAGGG